MRASALEFRLRFLIHAVIFALGFWSPWDGFLHLDGIMGSHQSLWLALASLPARNGLLSFSGSTVAVLLFGILFATLGAALRTWGSAYLGSSIVKDGGMHAGTVVADGPYRHLRNPLYLGTWIHALALDLLMPPTGAIFSVVLIGLCQARLIAGEEFFLASAIGPPYLVYRAAVPRIVPSIAPRVAAAGVTPRWTQAIVGEIYMIGVAASFLVFGWRYNAFLLTKCVLISLGLSLVARAFVPPVPETNASKQEPAINPGS